MQGTVKKTTLAVTATQALVAGVALASSEAETDVQSYGTKSKDYGGYGGYGGYGMGGYGGYGEKSPTNGYGKKDDYEYGHYGPSNGYGKKDGYEYGGYGPANNGYGKKDGYEYGGYGPSNGYGKKDGYEYGDNGYMANEYEHHGYGSSGYGSKGHYPHKHHHHHYHHPKGYGDNYHRYDVEPTYDASSSMYAYGYKDLKDNVNPYYFARKKKHSHKFKDLLSTKKCFTASGYGVGGHCMGVSLYGLAVKQCTAMYVSMAATVDTACDKADPKKKKHKKNHGYYNNNNGYEGDNYYNSPQNYDYGDQYGKHTGEYYARAMSENTEEAEYKQEPEEYYAPMPKASAYSKYDSAYGEIYKKFYPHSKHEMDRVQCLQEGYSLVLDLVLNCLMETDVMIAFVEKYSAKAQERLVRQEEVHYQAYLTWVKNLVSSHSNPAKLTEDYNVVFDTKNLWPYAYNRDEGLPLVFGKSFGPYNRDEGLIKLEDGVPQGVTLRSTNLKYWVASPKMIHCPNFPRTRNYYEEHVNYPENFPGVATCNKRLATLLGISLTRQLSGVALSCKAGTDGTSGADLNNFASIPTLGADKDGRLPIKPSLVASFSASNFEPFALTGLGQLIGCGHYACKAIHKGDCKLGSTCYPEVKIESDEEKKIIESDEFKELEQCIHQGWINERNMAEDHAVRAFLDAITTTTTQCSFGKDYIEVMNQARTFVDNAHLPLLYGSRPVAREMCSFAECKSRETLLDEYKVAVKSLVKKCDDEKSEYEKYLREWKVHHHDYHKHGHKYGGDDYGSYGDADSGYGYDSQDKYGAQYDHKDYYV